MAKRDQRGRTRHNGNQTASRIVKPARSPHSKLITVIKPHVAVRGHLYKGSGKEAHLVIHDPNIIMISATTPMNKTISYICKRLNETSKVNQERVKEAGESQLETVVVAAANSAMSLLVTMLELLKRRCPQLLYNLEIGTVNNTKRNAAAIASDLAKKSDGNDEKKGETMPAPKHAKIAYGIKATLLVQELIELDVN